MSGSVIDGCRLYALHDREKEILKPMYCLFRTQCVPVNGSANGRSSRCQSPPSGLRATSPDPPTAHVTPPYIEPGGNAGGTFRAVATSADVGEKTVTISRERIAALDVEPGTQAIVTPLS